MSTTYPDADNLRIPPKPRMARARPAPAAAPTMALQLAASALSAFGLAWLLSHLIIG